ncbi:hypothetical protein [Citrobacter sp. Cb220]|uniref:hypothetical protein n=1 Tax=Citrobacter sp. Cb220 TaxID=2985034 RepID=UPI0025764EC2|nr:hypothetical protein [Citrobacter sp. Cb220]MDM3314051.1 hypothetical protein [Citrobacter sp. Cb220]
MTYAIMSKKNYASAINAERACAKDGKKFVKNHQLPDGRWCYMFEPTFIAE